MNSFTKSRNFVRVFFLFLPIVGMWQAAAIANQLNQVIERSLPLFLKNKLNEMPGVVIECEIVGDQTVLRGNAFETTKIAGLLPAPTRDEGAYSMGCGK